MAVVISLGGSLINGMGSIDRKFLKQFRDIVLKGGEELGIVTGGGKVARDYASAAREFCGNNFVADEVAVAGTRLNAALVVSLLRGTAYPRVFRDFEKAAGALGGHRIVVMGGTVPGITTDTDSVLLAEAVGAKRVVNLSNVAGVYDSDPKTNPSAKKFDRMTHAQLVEMAQKYDQRMPGTNFVFDVVACKLAARSGLELHFVGGKNIKDLGNAIKGKRHAGTIVGAP
ncbi:MAG: UMP kinase [Candidatus ainarchaeum sp.]|nr:UMP kinase [Candidatus ainarchaeum sp.]MDD5096210.1 UMP kinase [Candidatus ainarchaeum sp.]